MSELLIKLFVKDYKNTGCERVRNRYGVLSGAVGIVLNVILSVFKMIFGKITGSISITADGANNLLDAGSSVINLAGFKLSGKPADKDHPFGHGRIEYMSALVLAFLVLTMGVELAKSSIGRFSSDEPVVFSVPAVIVLVCSIAGKIWLAYFNSKVGKRINSVAVDAIVKDSIGDIASTTASLIALILSKFTALPVDAVMGLAVSAFVLWSGIGIIRDTMGPILGEAPDSEIVSDMEKLVMSHEGILGIHDMIVHSYGHSKVFASLHAEVAANADMLETHDLIDNIERDVFEELGIQLSIHMDPINTDDERIAPLRSEISEIAVGIDKELTIHDLRIVDGNTHTNVIFDVVAPPKFRLTDDELKGKLCAQIKVRHPDHFAVITVDKSFI